MLCAGFLLLAGPQAAFAADEGVCTGRVEAPQQCRWMAGRVQVGNGTPAIRITQQGGHRVYAVGPSEHEWMPDNLRSRLTLDNAVQADFRICPIHRSQPNGLREVCVDEVKHLKVIDHP
ncbi:hypothetical protein GCM10007863_02070 [Dyella mobilis]|nr:hypothetical protein GCM10007863_02070 [Dyella mobilis]